jgi:hypothetical protein
VADYLRKIVENSSTIIDLFIECPPEVKNVPFIGIEPENYIKYTDKAINQCLLDNKCQNVRYHYADVRNTDDRTIKLLVELCVEQTLPTDQYNRALLDIRKWMRKYTIERKKASLIQLPSLDEIEELFIQLKSPTVSSREKLDEMFIRYIKHLATDMDEHILGQLLSTHDNKPIYTKCIVYAGIAHIEVYKKVLERQGYRLVEKGISHGERCVEISKTFI